jgi:hypothetical protein
MLTSAAPGSAPGPRRALTNTHRGLAAHGRNDKNTALPLARLPPQSNAFTNHLDAANCRIYHLDKSAQSCYNPRHIQLHPLR